MAGAQLPGMSTPEDLQQAGDYDEATVNGMPGEMEGMGDESAAPGIAVLIEMSPEGVCTITNLDTGEEQTAEDVTEAGRIAGEMLGGGAVAGAEAASESALMGQPGAEDAQAIWDEMASARPNRGNT